MIAKYGVSTCAFKRLPDILFSLQFVYHINYTILDTLKLFSVNEITLSAGCTLSIAKLNCNQVFCYSHELDEFVNNYL